MKRTRLPLTSKRRGGAYDRERLHLDELARAIVMIRAGAAQIASENKRMAWYGACEWCGKPRYLAWAHIEPKGRVGALRWDTDNARGLCWSCHEKWHNHPRAAEEWITAKMGAAARESLALRAQATKLRPDLDAMRLYLTACLHGVDPAGIVVLYYAPEA